MKYQVWVKENGMWMEQGDGPLTRKQAERISREIRVGCGVPVQILVEGLEPDQVEEAE